MEHSQGNSGGQGGASRLGTRLQVWRACRAASAAEFAAEPEPRSIGSPALGRQLLAGHFLFDGIPIEDPDRAIWDLAMPSPGFADALHGFAWMDDLAALGTPAALALAREWTAGWIARHGRGRGAGWRADLIGRRLIRWVNHGPWLLSGWDRVERDEYFRTLSAQAHFLSRRWTEAAPLLPRLEALTGLIAAGLAQKRHQPLAEVGIHALSRECTDHVDPEGGLASRNPEALLEVFTLLVWAGQAMIDAGRRPEPPLEAAVVRIAPILRALRHADGGLARFHGGGRGREGRLDQVLGAAGVRPAPHDGLAMGFARLAAGRTTVIVDAAPPPGAAVEGADPHASLLAFELTSGRRPFVVNCGPGAGFGETWRRACQTTASHSTLELHPGTRATPAVARRPGAPEPATRAVRLDRSENTAALGLRLAHDGYLPQYGLSHARHLTLARDGRRLSGEDHLLAPTEADRRRIDARTEADGGVAPRFTIRFHLHPDVSVQPVTEEGVLPMILKSGEVWEFWQDGAEDARVEPGVYLENGQPKPRPTRQIVLSGPVTSAGCRINWTFAKSQGTPQAIRDLVRDDDALPSD
ncbi:heparinase II/III family protein [Tropicimonas sp. IMCC34043]|uniref:heparinase II/III family protein n=1 Tax=Tropicimonas sp. IMCC34043 TaxID=2248760 RepID=UPI000E2530EF|nr:heparinase II/III family protein [Tropicimonas sp. IMCC34043]